MKTTTKLFLSLCLVIGLGATFTSQAQIQSDATIRANIPHPFVVNNTTLPAGNYYVTVAETTDLQVLEIRSANDKLAVLFDTEPVKVNRMTKQSELVFDQLGDTYFLSQVFMSGDEGGNQLVKSKKQRRLEDGGMTATKSSIQAERSSKNARKGD